MDHILFPFADYWWFYASFSGAVLVMLLVDLGIFHRQAHEVSFRESLIWSSIWIALALGFNYGLYNYALWKFPQDTRLTAVAGFDPSASATRVALEFLTGFVVEKSLAIDNIFIFVVVFSFFAIPPKFQHRILFYGIIGALIFRVLFIAIGSYLIEYKAVVMFFGVFLMLTGIKMFFAPEKSIDPEKNFVIRLLRRILPITPDVTTGCFFKKIAGTTHATPLFVALVFIEITDIVFAVDSVPAIFAITKEPLLVFTSNMFAILGLRSLYFLLAGAIYRFWLLKYGLAAILIFVGLKMVWLNELYGGKFPIGISLGIIGTLLMLSVIGSLLIPREHGGPAST